MLILCETEVTAESLTKYLDSYNVQYNKVDLGVSTNENNNVFELMCVLDNLGPKSFDFETTTVYIEN